MTVVIGYFRHSICPFCALFGVTGLQNTKTQALIPPNEADRHLDSQVSINPQSLQTITQYLICTTQTLIRATFTAPSKSTRVSSGAQAVILPEIRTDRHLILAPTLVSL